MDPLAQNQGNALPCDTCSACGACDFSENTFTFDITKPESFTPQLKTLFAGRNLAARNDGAFIIRLGDKVIMGQKQGSEFKGTVVGPKAQEPENTSTETQTPLQVMAPIASETFTVVPHTQDTEEKNQQQPSLLTVATEAIAHHQTQKAQTEENKGKTNTSQIKDADDEMLLAPMEYTHATTTTDFVPDGPAAGDITSPTQHESPTMDSTHIFSPGMQSKQAEPSHHAIQATSHEEPVFIADHQPTPAQSHENSTHGAPVAESKNLTDTPHWIASTILSDLPILEPVVSTEQPPVESKNVQQPAAQTEQPAAEPSIMTEQTKLVETHTEARRAVFAFLSTLSTSESRSEAKTPVFAQNESNQQTTEITLTFPDHPDALVRQFMIAAQAQRIKSEKPAKQTDVGNQPKEEKIEEKYEMREGTTSWIITLIRQQDTPVTIRADKEAIRILKKRLEKHLVPLLNAQIDEGAEEERITDPQPKPSHSIADPILLYISWLAYAWIIETLQHTPNTYQLSSTPVYIYS